MDEKNRETIEKLKQIGMNYTFDGEYVADFIERVDKILEINYIEFTGSKLFLWVGETTKPDTVDLLKVITKATLLNIQAAGYETTPQGLKMYFEWYISPWDEKHIWLTLKVKKDSETRRFWETHEFTSLTK